MTIVKTENGVSMYADSRKGTDVAQLHEMLCVWRQAAAMLKAGEITQDEYDRWRYHYPELDTSGEWHKMGVSQELSDMLVDSLKDNKEKV